MNEKCQAYTKDNKKCGNKAKSNGACGLSGHAEYVKANMTSKALSLLGPTSDYRHIEIPHLDAMFQKNMVKTSEKIRERLFKGPSPKDGPGHIYMYHIKRDAHKDYRKVGMTIDLPSRRVAKGWPGGTILKSWPCKRHKMAEKLIHLYLQYARVERWAVAIGTDDRRIYLSFWWNDNQIQPDTKERIPTEFVADRHFIEFAGKIYAQGEDNIVTMAKKMRLKKEKPHVEWFKEDEDVIVNCIVKVIGAINSAYKDEDWPSEIEGLK